MSSTASSQTMAASASPSTSPLDDSPAHVKAIAPYRPGKPIGEVAREYGLQADRIVKLASNENPLGMPASARVAIQAVLDDLGRYPDSNCFDLKAAISARYDVPVDWITLGNGSNDLLELAARAFCATGQSIVYSQYSFTVYALSTQAVELLKTRQRVEGSPFVFTTWSKSGHIVSPRDLLAKMSKVAGTKITAHDLRRTHTTIGIANCSIDFYKGELLTGHLPTTVTARHYLETSHLQDL